MLRTHNSNVNRKLKFQVERLNTAPTLVFDAG